MIIKINPQTGIIEQEWDISKLKKAEIDFQEEIKGHSEEDCLNGVAYNPENKHFYLTGK